MKKLLSLLAVSTLVVTSANNLKQVFTNNVVNHVFKSNQLNQEISNRSENDNPFVKYFYMIKLIIKKVYKELISKIL